MAFIDKTDRRRFLGRVAGAAAAFSIASHGELAEAQGMGPDDWLKNVKGTHRCLFDFPQHKNGMPLLHILNYLNTYAEAYKTTPGQSGAVGTFLQHGQSIQHRSRVQRRDVGHQAMQRGAQKAS